MMTEPSLILGWLEERGEEVSDLTWVCDFGYLRGKEDKSLLNEKWMAFFLTDWSAFPFMGKEIVMGIWDILKS